MTILPFYADVKPSEYSISTNENMVIVLFTMKRKHFNKFSFLSQFKDSSKVNRILHMQQINNIMQQISNDVIIYSRIVDVKNYTELGKVIRETLLNTGYISTIGKKKVGILHNGKILEIQKKKFASMFAYSMELTRIFLEIFTNRKKISHGVGYDITEIRILIDTLPYTGKDEFKAVSTIAMEINKFDLGVTRFKGGIYPGDDDKNEVHMILADWFAAIIHNIYNSKDSNKGDEFILLCQNFMDNFVRFSI